MTETSYLDVVNDILEQIVDPGSPHGRSDPYGRLRTLWFPFDKPFSLPYQRLRRYLVRLGVDPVEFYRLFAVLVVPDVVAREYLGLSPEEVDLITIARPAESDVRECYGLAMEEPIATLEGLDRFQRATGLTGAEVRELLWQRPAGLGPEAAGSFVRQGGPFVVLDEDGTRLVCDGGVPLEWFERVSRFVRLARRTGLSLTDLDLVLRSCCGNRLDGPALGILAVVRYLHNRLDLPVDVVCSLAAPMDTAGITADAGSTDLFGRTFGTGPASIAQRLISPGTVPEERTEPICVGDILAPANREFRRRVAGALAMSEADLATVVTRLRVHYGLPPAEPSPFDRGEVGLRALSLLHRVSRLSSALGISVDELFQVLAALNRDPALRRHTTFPILLDLEHRPRR